MKLSEFFRALDPTRWAMLAGAIALLVVAVFVIGRCTGGDGGRAEAGKTLADSRTASAADASTTRDTVEEKIDAINDNVKAGTDAIRNAPDDAARNDAALRSLCRVDPSASPDCGLLGIGPR